MKEVPQPRGNRGVPGLTARSVVTAAALSYLFVLWECRASLIGHACQVSEGTPSVPAVAALVVLSAIPLLLRRFPRLRFSPAELVCIYLVLYLAVPLSGPNSMRQLMPAMTALRYFAAPENHYAQFAADLPAWVAPQGEEVVRTFYEGADNGVVPWSAWTVPLAFWTVLMLALNASHFGLVCLFRRAWTEGERLSFPLADLAVQLADPQADGAVEGGLLRNKLFWTGVGVAALFNLTNILNAFNPTVPCLGLQFDFGAFLTEHPWNALRPLVMTFRPEVVGLGYLVNLDVLLSSWVFYLLLRVENFGTVVAGYSIPGMPFAWPQGEGAYLGLALFLVWGARRFLKAAAIRAWRGEPAADTEPVQPRASLLLFFGGTVLTLVLGVAVGMTPWAALWLTGFLGVAVLVYSRIRAQTGLPLSYVVPRRDIPVSLIDLVGASPVLTGGGTRGFTAFSLMTVITRLIFPQMAATELEGLQMGELTRTRHRDILLALAGGVVLGLALGYWSHLTAYYHFGGNILDGGTTEGGWRTRQALMQYERMETVLKNGSGTKWLPTSFRLVGLGVSVLLLTLRMKFLRFPLNPLGFAIAATFGHHVWFPLFSAYALKALTLRLGGPRVFRTLIPAFLGLAVGHFLIAGAIWGLVGALNETAGKRYLVWFA